MRLVRFLLIRAFVMTATGLVVYGVTRWVATELGQNARAADGWGWIAVVVALLLSGVAGDVWAPRFAGLGDRIKAGTEGGWDGRAEPGRRP